MPIDDLETRRLVAYAQRYLNYGESRAEVQARMTRYFRWDNAAQIREGLDLALEYRRAAVSIREHIAGRGAGGAQAKIAQIGGYLGMEAQTGQTVGVTIYFTGRLGGAQRFQGSTVVNVDAGASIFMVIQRACAAIENGHIQFPNAQYALTNVRCQIQSVTPYPRGRGFTLDTERATPTHPNPYGVRH